MPGGELRRPPRRALERRGRPRAARPRGPRRRAGLGDLPGRARARVVGAALPHGRPRCCCRPSPATSSSTGAATTTSAAAPTARCTPTTRSGALLWCGTGPDSADASDAVVAARHRADGARALRRARGVRAAPPRRSCSCALLAPAARRADALLAGRLRVPPPGWRMAPADVLREVAARPEVRRARAGHELTYGRVYCKSRAKHRWQVSFFAAPRRTARRRRSRRPSSTTAAAACSRAGRATRSPGRWRAATPGRSGGIANALWIWLPLCVLFVLPFARAAVAAAAPRPRWCCSRSRSRFAFFNAARIDVSVPLVYPLLAYLLVRMLVIARGRASPRRCGYRARRHGSGSAPCSSRLPLRAQRRRLERDRRRLRERDRRRPLRLRPGGLRPLPARQPARRHLRAGPLLRLRAVRGAAARGAAAGTTCPPPTRRRWRSTC